MPVPFEFKQFRLSQEKSAFKLGTDSVVLGSWLKGRNFQRVLDIGTGTGILALMMAQRFCDCFVTAIELDNGSVEDCVYNFENSAWCNRLQVVNKNIIEWSEENVNKRFDLIVSNPPYFVDSLKNPDQRKSAARHTHSLGLDHLSEIAQKHLADDGLFCFILPVIQFNELKKILGAKNIHPSSICSVSSYENSLPIRKMGCFGFQNADVAMEEHFLYNKDKTRSDWYRSISNDFYIR
jgi:tRNA1Val (adenine37-N6)-methyltransferase